MADWFATRMGINRQIRVILVRHCIDLGQLRMLVTRRRVSIRGHLTTINGSGRKLNDQAINQLFLEIEQIEGAGRVYAELDNWNHDSDGDEDEWVGDVCDAVPGEYTFSNVDMEQLKARMESRAGGDPLPEA